MQNYQGSLKKVSTNLREHFDEFFLENDRPHLLKAVKPLPKMPDFQRSYSCNAQSLIICWLTFNLIRLIQQINVLIFAVK